MYNDKYIKTEITIYNKKLNTNFSGDKILENNKYCTYLTVVL